MEDPITIGDAYSVSVPSGPVQYTQKSVEVYRPDPHNGWEREFYNGIVLRSTVACADASRYDDRPGL